MTYIQGVAGLVALSLYLNIVAMLIVLVALVYLYTEPAAATPAELSDRSILITSYALWAWPTLAASES